MKLSVLIPYRPDSEHRARVKECTERFWQTSGLEVIYASDGGKPGEPFSFSRAINAARKQATGDWFLSYSADALPPSKGLLGFLEQMLTLRPWASCMRGQLRYSHHQTELILRGQPPSSKTIGMPAGGISLGHEAILAVRADAWDLMRGYDERFVGWGQEDRAWHLALKSVCPDGWDHPTGEFFHTLWHPPVPRTQLTANTFLFQEYQKHAENTLDFANWYFSKNPHDEKP